MILTSLIVGMLDLITDAPFRMLANNFLRDGWRWELATLRDDM